MFNITGRFVTVFQPEMKLNVSERMVFANLSTSKKNTGKDGSVTYENMSWKGRFVGDAFEPSKALCDGDKIDIKSGMISNKYDKEKKVLYVDVTIFSFVLSYANKDTVQGDSVETASIFGDINGDSV